MNLFGRRKGEVATVEVQPIAAATVTPSFTDLIANRQSIDSEIKAMQEAEIAMLKRNATTLASVLNISIAELLGLKVDDERPRRKRREVKAKYKHPTEDLTWSGRGKPPKWILELIAAGNEKSKFLIE